MHFLHTEFIVGSSPTIATTLRWLKSEARVCKTLLCWCESSPQLHLGMIMKKYIHVNQHVIRANKKHNENNPVITIAWH